VSDELLKTYGKRPKICLTIMNCSEDQIESVPKVKSNLFRVLFSGHIKKGRGLEVLSDIVKDLKDVDLVITGRVEDKQLLNKLNGLSNLTYLGYLDENKLLQLEANSDAMVALYDLNLQTQNEFVVGNKLFKSMMLGIPIITNVAREIVKETGCGILVDYDNSDELRNAIINLKSNTELSKTLGENGRKSFLQKYNWKIMEQRLYDIYDGLLNLHQ
jgi:glycosyltransferase involved in cell wall biosynthesis